MIAYIVAVPRFATVIKLHFGLEYDANNFVMRGRITQVMKVSSAIAFPYSMNSWKPKPSTSR
ncbi:hypothetical protein [Gloeocapsopsis crepidinum]|uniref:hypothetical protein n=1 Tax=Gloeocapsopsis crepidinum TaxID=693223 RepID=UPI00187DECC5